MKVLIVGKGAREHAIAWKLRQSPQVDELLVAPGNAGTAQIARNVPVAADDVDGQLRLAAHERVDFTVVGPEAPLAAGIVDRFQEAGLLVFGPTQAAARVETSKSFAKQLMQRNGIPTAGAEDFDSYVDAEGYVNRSDPPFVVKADGLADGKAVTVAETVAEAIDALRQAMVDRRFGDAGRRVLIEERLEGTELSVFAFVDGHKISSLVAACDYKPVGDGNTGPNTGGMGSYSPPPEGLWSSATEERVRDEIMQPIVGALALEGAPYQGVLYAGLMMTVDGPKVIEFNCRLGDPEAQVVLPRLKTDLLQVMIASARGDLDETSLEWDARPCVGVVVASGGYPGEYSTGHVIDGLDGLDEGALVFHAGSKTEQGRLVSDGGRVLTVAALAGTVEEARARAYSNVERVGFAGSFYRRDIAAQPAVSAQRGG